MSLNKDKNEAEMHMHGDFFIRYPADVCTNANEICNDEIFFVRKNPKHAWMRLNSNSDGFTLRIICTWMIIDTAEQQRWSFENLKQFSSLNLNLENFWSFDLIFGPSIRFDSKFIPHFDGSMKSDGK